jgi:mono/diheme cytochrome c family protein
MGSMKFVLKSTALLTLVIFVSACNHDSTFRGWVYMPDMYDGPALETHEAYGAFKDSASSRKPVKGTIPRGFMSYQEFSPAASGYDSAKAVLKMPKAILSDAYALEQGKDIYNIFCTHCHGEKGAGKGVLVMNEKFLGVPSYADREINLGSIFHVVTYGKGVMGSHAAQLTPQERWKVAQYVLQLRAGLTGETAAPENTEENTETAEAAGVETTATDESMKS